MSSIIVALFCPDLICLIVFVGANLPPFLLPHELVFKISTYFGEPLFEISRYFGESVLEISRYSGEPIW